MPLGAGWLMTRLGAEAPVAARFGREIVRRPVCARGDRRPSGNTSAARIRNCEIAVGWRSAAGIGPELEIGSVRADEQEIQVSREMCASDQR